MAERHAGRSLARPAFPDDDGAPDPALRARLAQGDGDLIAALATARLIVPIVAVLDARDEHGGDKESHMAVVSMVNADGERGMLAFTGVDSLGAWDPAARPVPVLAPDAARAAIADGAAALVIDVAGPVRVVLQAEALTALAAVHGSTP